MYNPIIKDVQFRRGKTDSDQQFIFVTNVQITTYACVCVSIARTYDDSGIGAIESTSCQLSGEIRNVGQSFLFRADDAVQKLMQHHRVYVAMALRETTQYSTTAEDACEHAVSAHARLSPACIVKLLILPARAFFFGRYRVRSLRRHDAIFAPLLVDFTSRGRFRRLIITGNRENKKTGINYWI